MNEALKRLQEKCGAVGDGHFGPNTARAICQKFELTPVRGAHLLGQVVHESGSFRITKENLNYSAERITVVFKKYFKTLEEAKPYSGNPKGLANKVYGGRMGNGKTDGYTYIGRGFLQLTGKSNYRSFAADMGVPEVMADPSLIETEYAFDTAIWFFEKNGLFKMSDAGVTDEVIKKVSKKVNGGYNGLKHRIKVTHQIYNWLI